MKQKYSVWLAVLVSLCFQVSTGLAEEQTTNAKAYQVQAGDLLEVNVWKEEGMVQDVLVRPDGGLSFPLVGDIQVQGMSLQQVQQKITKNLAKYISDPVVTVAAKQLLGNKIYVIGKVNQPGEFIANSHIDVMQALSMARGMTPFAAVNDIVILRRDNAGKQSAIEFRYGDVEDGEDLEQNIILQSGDVVVVP